VFKKILVANRGEIALRVIRACREMGIASVAVYSECDANSLHVQFADEAVCIGPPEALKSYLHIPNVLTAADVTGADAIHPGYGFLAENADFARKTAAHGMTFIGPTPETLVQFGDKLLAKAAARAANLPLVPGSTGEVGDEDEASKVAEQIGYPVMLKASAGGGGKGMRVARDEAELRRLFAITAAEAVASFGNGALFLERFLERPRHIEIQIAGDGKGNAIHFAERDCSIQRRHQKLIEEAPAVGLSDTLRAAIREAATRLVADNNYISVGTVEFLVEGEDFFFLEVNPRIQVEHPVTEAVTNVDLVQLQIVLAAGEGLPFVQEDIVVQGHAIELRINAEHPRTFLPSPGRITGFHLAGGPGIRVDSAVHEQAMVQPYYDSLVAKLIVRAKDRPSAIRRAQRALQECIVEGIHTSLPLHRDLLASDEFRDLAFHTRFLEGWIKARYEES
jgi:acetyl-CoA carboxylase biotin carboxylase subunit